MHTFELDTDYELTPETPQYCLFIFFHVSHIRLAYIKAKYTDAPFEVSGMDRDQTVNS